MSEWINPKERIPSKGDFVLVWDGSDVCMLEYNGAYFGLKIDGKMFMVEPLAWMPLPEPPKE